MNGQAKTDRWTQMGGQKDALTYPSKNDVSHDLKGLDHAAPFLIFIELRMRRLAMIPFSMH